LQPVQKKRPGGESAPLPGLSTVLPWPYFLCRAVSVWFPRRRNSINPTPKSVNAANATVGVDTPVLASWRIVFTMAGVAGGMYELVNSGRVPVVVTVPGVVDGPSPTASPLVLSVGVASMALESFVFPSVGSYSTLAVRLPCRSSPTVTVTWCSVLS